MGLQGETPAATIGFQSASLRAARIAPAEITDILLSHLHPDHIGGLFEERGTPIFPNARYHACRDEAAFWRNPKTDLGGTGMPPERRTSIIAGARRFLTLAGDRIRLFPARGEPIPGIAGIQLPGHTEGQMGYIFHSDGERLVYAGETPGLRPHLRESGAWRNAPDPYPGCRETERNNENSQGGMNRR